MAVDLSQRRTVRIDTPKWAATSSTVALAPSCPLLSAIGTRTLIESASASCQPVPRQYNPCQGTSSFMKAIESRNPDSEALIAELKRLTGPDGSDQSDREIEAEMKELNIKFSHERIRQCRKDEWTSLNHATRRKLRTYLVWKNARTPAQGGDDLADVAAMEAADHRERTGRPDVSRDVDTHPSPPND